MNVQQVHLLVAPLPAQFSHAGDLLQQFLLAHYPNREQLLGNHEADLTFQHELVDADITAGQSRVEAICSNLEKEKFGK